MAVAGYAVVTRYGTSASYHGLNLLGASGLVANAFHHRSVPLVALNLVWAFIAVCGLAMMTLKRRDPV